MYLFYCNTYQNVGMFEMQGLIDKYYKKETKVIDGGKNRQINAVLVPEHDVLQVVYDVYTFIDRDCNKSPVNMIFLHGSGMNRVVWEYYIAYLVHNVSGLNWQPSKIIVMDQVTHGDSFQLNKGKIGVGYDWIDGARDACKISLREFKISEINVIVGHSMGGFQALAAAVLYPDFFNMVLPIEPVIIPHVVPTDFKQHTIVNSSFVNALTVKMKDEFANETDYRHFMENKSFYVNTHTEIRDRIIEFERLLEPDGKIRTKMDKRQNILCYMTLNPGASWLIQNLKFIRAPVYGIVGGSSGWTPPENQGTLIRELQTYHKYIVPEGDHLLNLELPDIVLGKIVTFIQTFLDKDTVLKQSSPKCDSKTDLTNEQRQGALAREYRNIFQQRIVDYKKVRDSKL